MAMDDYAQAAEEFKEEIITQFLKDNPGVRRTEIAVKYVNGKMICEQIKDVFRDISLRKPVRSPSEKRLLKELARGGDLRFTASLESINSSRLYVDWLHTAPYTSFGDMEKSETMHFLQRKEEQCNTYVLDLIEAKKKLSKMMKLDVKPSESATKTVMTEYFQTSLVQMKCQHSVYSKEVDLGDSFANNAQKFIRENFGDIKARAKISTITAIKKAYNILRSTRINMPDITSNEKLKLVGDALDELKEQLDKKRKELQAIFKMIEFLQGIVDTLETSVKDDAKKKDDGKSGGSPRMAFTRRSR
jgi:hypothetical protein